MDVKSCVANVALRLIKIQTDEESRRGLILKFVTRRVLWGDLDAEILESLAANGITKDESKKLLRAAHRERVKAIRAIYWPSIAWGILFIEIGLELGWIIGCITEHFTIWNNRMIVIPSFPVTIGLW